MNLLLALLTFVVALVLTVVLLIAVAVSMAAVWYSGYIVKERTHSRLLAYATQVILAVIGFYLGVVLLTALMQ